MDDESCRKNLLVDDESCRKVSLSTETLTGKQKDLSETMDDESCGKGPLSTETLTGKLKDLSEPIDDGSCARDLNLTEPVTTKLEPPSETMDDESCERIPLSAGTVKMEAETEILNSEFFSSSIPITDITDVKPMKSENCDPLNEDPAMVFKPMIKEEESTEELLER
jgi:hypothetical protein